MVTVSITLRVVEVVYGHSGSVRVIFDVKFSAVILVSRTAVWQRSDSHRAIILCITHLRERTPRLRQWAHIERQPQCDISIVFKLLRSTRTKQELILVRAPEVGLYCRNCERLQKLFSNHLQSTVVM